MPAPTRAPKLPPTPDPRCGTIAGYSAHRRRGESACPACHAANRNRSRESHRRYRATPAGQVARRESHHRYLATPAGLATSRAATHAARDRLRNRTPEECDADFARLRPSGKPCTGCGELLSAKAFSRNWTSSDGRERRCAPCTVRHRHLKRDRKLRAHWEARGINPAACLYCDAPASELEHVLPKALGGSDDPSNLAPACPACNHGIGGKHDRHPIEWLRATHPDRLDRIVQLYPHIQETTHA